MYTIYGIPNCNTIKKTLQWFHTNNIPYQFHDYKQSGISLKKLEQWSNEAGIEKLLNKKSTTWRSLTDSEKENSIEISAAQKLMRENLSLIKRPAIEQNGKLVAIGFDPALYVTLFKPQKA